jgi:hypothetical protein
MSVMLSCWKYHGCEQLRLEVPYPTMSYINSYVQSFLGPFLLAKTTPTTGFCDIDDGQKHPIIHWGASELTP